MQIILVDNDWIHFRGISEPAERLLLQEFSVRHPRHRFLNNAHWDGWYRRYYESSQKMSRPFLKEVCEVLDKGGFPYDVVDAREGQPPSVNPEDVTDDILPGITLDDYQVEAIQAMCANECGVISVTTGGGKTELMAGIVKLLNVPTLIIGDIKVVIKQIKERMELRDVEQQGKGVGLFYSGSRPNGQRVVVGSIQSLSSPKKPAPNDKNGRVMKFYDEDGNFDHEKWERALSNYQARRKTADEFQRFAKQAQLLLVDECDKASANNYKELFNKIFKGRYKYGFSGTPFDKAKPVDNLFLRERLGPVIYDVERKAVEERGRIIPITIIFIAVGEDGSTKDKRRYPVAEREEVIENAEMHWRIQEIVNTFPDERFLIVVDTHAIKELGKALEEKLPKSKFIYGQTSTKQRDQAVEDFQNHKLRCLIGSKIIKRGLDLKGGSENTILLGGGNLESNFDQIVGRQVRQNSRGWGRLFAFYYLNNHYLAKHSREQIKAAVAMGYEVMVSFRDGIVSGEDLIKSRWRLRGPKKAKR